MSRVAVAGLGAVLLGCSVLLGVLVHDAPPALDATVTRAALEHRTRPLVVVSSWISFVLSPGSALIAVLALGVRTVLARDALLLRCTVLFGLCWSTLLARYCYQRVRPVDFPKWSYPSGHVTAVTSAAFTAVVLCAWLARRWLRAAVALAVTAVALTAASRVVLQMHWPTDTAGAVLGVTGAGLLASAALGLLPHGRSLGVRDDRF
ncbi:phosphatase PAP2 family protein [Umezawaea beigongshangensis]|uniref:phosphatase PAP2 family protein n=1 Tax=Umezawaea beigongshangensis TaxID=2780383 RepID=UPI0018F1C036|nr:phosphatase PAP2 family protein [Umezawaea beigongshangensis]